MKNKILSLFIAVAVIIGVVPIATLTVSAATYSGTCGANLTWTVDTITGVLEINGTGDMERGYEMISAPWRSYADYIKTIIISEGVTNITNVAFGYCVNLTEITIPSSITYIGSVVFSGCTSLTAINVVENNVNYSSVGGVLFNKDKTTLVQYPVGKIGSYIIPGSVTNIGNSAFYGCTGLTSITIPDSVASVGNSAFSGCTSLELVTFESPTPPTFESYVFNNTPKLTTIYVPEGSRAVYNAITLLNSYNVCECHKFSCECISIVVGHTNGIVTSSNVDNALAAVGLTKNKQFTVTFEDGVTSIGKSAFSQCSGLTSIEIPDGVTNIDEGAFSSCTNLISITISDSVTSIGSNVFNNTPWLNNQPNGVIYAGKIAYTWKGDMPANTSITLRSDTKSIAEYAFRNCANLAEIIIPNGVINIEESAFSGCSGLNEVTIPDSVKSIGNSAFSSCTSLKSATFKGATPPSFGIWVFGNAPMLSKIYVPIGSKAAYQAVLQLSNIIGICDVIFNSQGGSAVATVTDIIEGEKITEPTAPTREHYSFGGWYKESDCINEWDFDVGTVTDIITLYAKWIPDTYGITYHLNGGTSPPNPPITYTYGTSTDLPVPTRTGYTFDGWYEHIDFYSEKLSETGATRAGTLVLYAKWEVRTYTVTYNANGGTGAPSPQDKTHNVFLVLSSSMPIFTGHTFLGWAANDPNSSAPNYMSGVVNYFTDNADVTLYAVWQCNLYICENCEKICPNKCACPICECDCINKVCHDCGVCEVCNPPQTTTTTETTTTTTETTTTTAEVTTTTVQTTAHTTTTPNTSTPTDTTTAPNTSTSTDMTTAPNMSTSTDMTTSASTTDIPVTTTTGTGTDTDTENTTTPATTTTPEGTTTPPTTTTPPVTCDCDEISCEICNPDGEFLALGDIDGENGVTIFDALEILKYLVGMGNAMDDNPEALRAGIISENGFDSGEPTIFCALEVLKYLVSMDSRVDGIHIHGTPIE